MSHPPPYQVYPFDEPERDLRRAFRVHLGRPGARNPLVRELDDAVSSSRTFGRSCAGLSRSDRA